VLFFYIDKRCYYSKFAGVYKNKAVVNTATKGTNGRQEILKQYRLGIIFYIPVRTDTKYNNIHRGYIKAYTKKYKI